MAGLPNAETEERDESVDEVLDRLSDSLRLLDRAERRRAETTGAVEDSAGDGEPEETTAETSRPAGSAESGRDESGDRTVTNVATRVRETVGSYVDHPLDKVVGVQRTDDGWRTDVELLERRSIPDTQDVLGRYVVSLAPSGEVTGYRRVARYRRDEVTGDRER